jgi:hypothetical protein
MQNQIYASFYQLLDQWVPAFQRDLSIVVRTPLTISALKPTIQAMLDGVNGGQPVLSHRNDAGDSFGSM